MRRITVQLGPMFMAVAVAVALGALGAGAAFAQPSAGSAAPADPAAAPAAAPADPTPAAAATAAPAGSARDACAAAMNADPKFAAEIVKIADEKAAVQRDADTVKAHTDAYAHVQKDERHVIIGYAAIWLITAGFVLYLWRRQQGLKLEIAQLARELDAAEAGKSPGKS